MKKILIAVLFFLLIPIMARADLATPCAAFVPRILSLVGESAMA